MLLEQKKLQCEEILREAVEGTESATEGAAEGETEKKTKKETGKETGDRRVKAVALRLADVIGT